MSHVDDLALQFKDARTRAAALITPLSHAQFNLRPRPQSWSIAECIDHLLVSARVVQARMRPAIDEGHANGFTSQGPFRYGWFSRWFEAEMEPPPRRRLKAPAALAIVPGSDHDAAAALRAFHETGEGWLELLDLSLGLDLVRIKMASPANRLFRFPLGAYFRINAAHERRHLWQAEQVLAATVKPGLGSPPSARG